MKIYYNFNSKQRNFSLAPSGKCISTETERTFRPGIDNESYRYYPDCNAIVVKGEQFKIYIITYDDGERDYLADDDMSSRYYMEQKEKYKHIVPVVNQVTYYKFGYKVDETTYKYNDNYFIETEWTKN